MISMTCKISHENPHVFRLVYISFVTATLNLSKIKSITQPALVSGRFCGFFRKPESRCMRVVSIFYLRPCVKS